VFSNSLGVFVQWQQPRDAFMGDWQQFVLHFLIFCNGGFFVRRSYLSDAASLMASGENSISI
jgi:hypothetical protein